MFTTFCAISRCRDWVKRIHCSSSGAFPWLIRRSMNMVSLVISKHVPVGADPCGPLPRPAAEVALRQDLRLQRADAALVFYAGFHAGERFFPFFLPFLDLHS